MMDAQDALELSDWRRAVGELYAEVRRLGAGTAGWEAWRAAKLRLYAAHPQSPVLPEHRAGYAFACYPYDPSLRVLATVVPSSPRHVEGDGAVPGMTHVGTLTFALHGADQALGMYWLDGYAGGLFVPFADATSGSETYGGGRYVLDTAKGADLGIDGDHVILDFNYSYAPSCAHDPQWRCPLAPAANRLKVAVRGGERL